MRRTRGGYRRAAAVLPAVLLLGGCGIQPTDVIGAGRPAIVPAALDQTSEMLLFFHSPDGELMPVSRPIAPYDGAVGTAAPPSAAERAVLVLLAGPDKDEEAAGLRTSLPPATPREGVWQEDTSRNGVRTSVPVALKGLDETALQQLICTITYATGADGRTTVRMRGEDSSPASGTCDLGTTPVRSETGTEPPGSTG
ncbi:hypothetical protein ACFRKB_35485 [Streptomyces scopuliridis]|uniref:hypothetical protein n=1 Tax=Streptomyces scopuliridis TaxID=452529 RepID=UPI00369D0ECC